jgi:hypothetical protein
MWGALSDDRTDLSFTRVTVRSSKSVCTLYILHVIKRMYICVNVCIYNIYKGLCQSRLSTTDHALLLISPATTAVYSLERSYA